MFQVEGKEYVSSREIADELHVTYRTVLDVIEKLKLIEQPNPSDMRQRGYPRTCIPDIWNAIVNRAQSA